MGFPIAPEEGAEMPRVSEEDGRNPSLQKKFPMSKFRSTLRCFHVNKAGGGKSNLGNMFKAVLV